MSKKDHILRSPSKSKKRCVSTAPAMLESLEPRLLLSLVAHLELNETSGSTAADSVGNHDGTLSGDMTWDDGRISNGAYFDGTNDNIQLANSNDFDFGTSTSFTVSTWVRDDAESVRYAIALSRGNDQPGWNTANGPGWAIGHQEYTPGRFWFRLTDGTNSASYGVTQNYDSAFFHLLTMVVDRSTSTMYCYIDGVLDGSTSISSIGSISSSGEAMTIGEGYSDWKGMVDDVRIYDRVLSADDVETLYTSPTTWVIARAEDAIATESASTTDAATFRVYRQGSTSGALTVNYSVSGTASSSDYSETLGGTVTITDGESYADITVTPVADAADDGETLILTLTFGTGYDVSPIDSATIMFYDEGKLLAHLALDETSGSTAADSTGDGFTGTVTGATWTIGQIDNGASFDGSGDTITVANASGIDFGGSQSFTVSAWVRQDGSLWNKSVLSKGNYSVSNSGTTTEYTSGWAIGSTAPSIYSFGVSDGATKVSIASGSCSSEFHFVTMVVDRDAQMLYGYVDGSFEDSADISSVGSLASFEDPLYISRSISTWTGVIDDVRVYTYALDSTAVGDLYDAGLPEISIAAINATAIEDTADTATFRVYRNNAGIGVTVNYSVSGTASSADYSETLSGTVTIATGESYTDITITPLADTADDGETLTLTLTDGTGYRVGEDDAATATIYDTDHLLAHLALDETSGSTADDSVGSHDGTLSGDTAWDDGRINNGAYFDGTNDSIQLADSNDFDFGASTSFTISAWVQDNSDGRYAVALSRGNDQPPWNTANGAGWAIGHYEYTPGRFWFRVTDGSGKINYYTNKIYDPTMFHLTTMVIDRSAAMMYCYVDGALDGSASIASIGSISSPGEALTIGEAYTDWQGMIDDVRVYGGRTLSADDVATLYADAPAWALVTAADSTAIEDTGDTASFRIYRQGSTSGAMTVNYSVSGTAFSGDYSETLGGTVTIADGESYTDITITPVSDAADDGETLTLTLAAGTGYAVGNLGEATTTLYDTGRMLARLTLDETSGSTAADSIGDHHGTRYGETVWDDARIDNGAYFDGSGDAIDIANSTDFDFGASQSFTVSSWVRDDGSGSYASVVSRGGTTAQGLGYGSATQGPGWFMGKLGTEQDMFTFSISDGANGTFSGGYTPAYTDGYHLLTMVVDRAAQQMLCYVDSVLIATEDISSIGNISSSSSSLLQIGGSGTWKGMIDDVRVYNYALSGTDVGDVYGDAPTWITIYADDAMASEDAAGTDGGTFRVLRTGSLSGAMTVNYSVSGTASSGDYSETFGGMVMIGDGESSTELTVTPVDDGITDNGEVLTLTLASGTGYDTSPIDSATVTIYDEPQLLAHWKMDETSGSSVADATGNGFTATRYGDSDWDYGRVGNGAYFDGSGDYIAVADANGLDFGNEQSFTVSAWVRDDGTTANPSVVAKGNTKANLGQIAGGAGWAMGRSWTSAFNFGVTDGANAVSYATYNMYPSDSGFHLMTMTVDRDAQLLRCFIDGELLAQEDISSVGSLASFAKSLYIGFGNTYAEGMIDDVRIYDYALSTSQVADLYAAVPPVVSIEAVVANASETGPVPGTFRVTREGSTNDALAVDYNISGTATSGDYSETLSGTVTIAAGDSTADITITPVDDASAEGDETVIATLTSSTTDYSILATTSGTATVTIGDNDNVSDPQVVIGVTDGDASEDGNDSATFRIYRSGATTSDLAVNYSVSGTADSSDYSETLSGIVTIASGNSYADITVTPVTDTNFEYPETLTLTLTSDATYSIGLSDAAAATISDVPFSEQLNPTGDPIGGGVGYSDIISSASADYVVDTASELIDALSNATYGDIVYVEDGAEIDLAGYITDTAYGGLVIPSGVTLASGRGSNGSSGGLIYTTDEWDNMNRVGMLVTGGDDVRITGLRIQGPSGYNLDAATDGKYAVGIRGGFSGSGTSGNHKNLEVDNCEIYDWTMAGVYVMYGEGVEVHHNFIHTNMGEGYQYGIWFGGNSDPGATWVAKAEANLFDCNRHDIGSASQWPWVARYNIFGPNQYLQILDRHGGPSVDTWVENNWNQADVSMEFRCGFTSDDGGTVYYNNNWTTKEEAGPGTSYPTSAVIATTWPLTFDAEASGNTFSFDEYDDAYTPVSASTMTYLSTPYTVAFDSSDSYDPEGNTITAHQWWLGDGSSQQGEVSYEDNPTYTYADPGMYEVIHGASNEYGVPGYESNEVIVRPTDSGYWLSAWVKDSSTGTPSGNSTKQILIGDDVVWSDDVYGDEGWQHVVVDISSYVTEGTSVKLSFRLVSDGSYHVGMSVDNAYIFGGDVGDPEMTNANIWQVSEPSNWFVEAAAVRVGRLTTTGGKLETWGSTAGTGEIYQYVPIGKPLAAMALDDFESGDATGGENWDANWVLTGSAAVTSSDTPYDGTYHLLLTSSAAASRAVDLSDYDDDVTLSFEYKADSFETGEEVSVEIYDGTQWQEVMVIEDGDDDGEYHLASIDLSGYSLTEDFEVRFTASLADAGDFFYVDDLMIA